MKANVLKCFFSIVIGCIGMGFFLEGAELRASESPAIIAETSYNFGELSESAPVSHDFIVKNTGKNTLNIRDVKPGCGCTIARFDRAVPPGGEGKVTLVLDLSGFQGYVKKSALVLSDDPANPRVTLFMEGTVKPLIEILPEKTIYFQGMADELTEKTIDLITTAKPFHIRKIQDSLDKKAGYRLETLEDGKQYRLRVFNSIPRGSYRGTITLYTDYPEKPELTVWVNGFVEGEIGIRPAALIIGQLYQDQGVASGKVMVINNKKRPFKITRCTYDDRIIDVTQSSLPNEMGFGLEVKPKMENIPFGRRVQTVLTVETDASSQEKLEVQITAINLEAGSS